MARVARTGDAHAGGVRAGMHAQGVHTQGWWGHSANQITGGDTQPIRLHKGCVQGLRAQGVYAGVVGTLSQSEQEVRGGVRGGARRCTEGCPEVHGGARRGARRCVEGLPLVAPSNH